MRIAIILLDDVWDSGIATINDVIGAANVMRSQVDRPPPPWEVQLVGSRRDITTAGGHRIRTTPLDSLHEPPDMVILPPTGFCPPDVLIGRLDRRHARLAIEQVAAAYSDGSQVLAACSGVFYLAESRIVEGKMVTTSWWLAPLFRERYPRVIVDTGATLIVEDRVTTAGAAFAQIDLALTMVRQQSPSIADLVMRYLLIGERASQASFAVPSIVAQYHPDMCRFEQWARSHLSDSIRIGDAAAALGLSERSLQRVTAAVMGMTPVEFLNEIRLDEAVYLLRTTRLSADAVAGRVGFRNSSTLRQLARR